MSALQSMAAALDLLARYDALPAAERNYNRAIWCGLLAGTVRDLAAAIAGPGGGALTGAYENGEDRFAYETGCLIRELRNSGRDAADVLAAVEDTIAARMEVGLPPQQWIGGGW